MPLTEHVCDYLCISQVSTQRGQTAESLTHCSLADLFRSALHTRDVSNIQDNAMVMGIVEGFFDHIAIWRFLISV